MQIWLKKMVIAPGSIVRTYCNTGATKGTGKAIADRLLKAGATVIIAARNKPETETQNFILCSCRFE